MLDVIHTVKVPSTIYNSIVDNCLMHGERRFPIKMAVNEFIMNGYGQEKAKKWVFQCAMAAGDHINEPWINIER